MSEKYTEQETGALVRVDAGLEPGTLLLDLRKDDGEIITRVWRKVVAENNEIA
jgi:hypothetical protein